MLFVSVLLNKTLVTLKNKSLINDEYIKLELTVICC